jgi:glycosyltransferase involved in cell wall biosynthesis
MVYPGKEMKLTVIIPYYNEPTLISLLRKLYAVKFPENINLEVITVDDGSHDNMTSELEKNIADFPGLVLMKHTTNKGKGAAIKTGLANSTGDIVIVQDADLEYNPSEIPNVIQPIVEGRTKVCYGSRHLDKEQKKQNLLWFKKHFRHSFMAAIGGRMITWLFNLLYGAGITDAPTCYKAFSTEFLKGIVLKNNGFNMEAELTAKILKKTRILEIPVHFAPRTKREGKKIRWHDGIRSVAAIIKYRFVN